MSKKTIILGIMVILWMGLIFYMSSNTGDDSGGTSEDIVKYIVAKYDKITNASQETVKYHESREFMDKANYYFRKTCHFVEYMILSILLLCFVISLDKFIIIKCSLYSLLISIFYACTDEFHQMFVPGRGGNIKDVIIDSCGALFGIIFVHLIYTCKNKNKEIRR